MGRFNQTEHWPIHTLVENDVDKLVQHPSVQEAAKWIRADETVAFPTETVYGLGANALSDVAVNKIFKAKRRPNDNPLIIHVACAQDVDNIVDMSALSVDNKEIAERLMDAFWPGPLTLILPKATRIGELVSARLRTVAVRVPNHILARALIIACGKPLAAPSANESGRPSPTTAEHVLHDLKGRIAGVLDAGPTGIGLESTVVDVCQHPPLLLRPGGISAEEIEHVLPSGIPLKTEASVSTAQALETSDSGSTAPASISDIDAHDRPASPGMKYRHYAPQTELILVSRLAGVEQMTAGIQRYINKDRQDGYRVGVLCCSEREALYDADAVYSIGREETLSSVASNLYTALRHVDTWHVDRVYVEALPEQGIGVALMNRLRKAADGRILSSR